VEGDAATVKQARAPFTSHDYLSFLLQSSTHQVQHQQKLGKIVFLFFYFFIIIIVIVIIIIIIIIIYLFFYLFNHTVIVFQAFVFYFYIYIYVQYTHFILNIFYLILFEM
jgi:hypothetical protein